VGVTAGSREVPGRKPVTRDDDDDDDDDDDNNNNNNNNNVVPDKFFVNWFRVLGIYFATFLVPSDKLRLTNRWCGSSGGRKLVSRNVMVSNP
jgi:hypothetical protein